MSPRAASSYGAVTDGKSWVGMPGRSRVLPDAQATGRRLSTAARWPYGVSMNRICPCGYSVPKGVRCTCSRQAAKARQKANDTARGSASQRGYGAEWRKASAAFLKALGAPPCACGCGRQADMVDHIRAPKGDMRLFWDRANWQPYNGLCNRRKNIRDEGGFGR